MAVNTVPPGRAERQQWRAVAIDRHPDGDREYPGEWRDNRTEALADRDVMERADEHEMHVIEVQWVADPQGERVPFIPREIPRPEPETMAYIGTAPCGCVTFALIIGAGTAEAEANELRLVARGERRIDRVSVEEANLRLTTRCEHEQQAAA